jgi:hypothetical protein
MNRVLTGAHPSKVNQYPPLERVPVLGMPIPAQAM